MSPEPHSNPQQSDHVVDLLMVVLSRITVRDPITYATINGENRQLRKRTKKNERPYPSAPFSILFYFINVFWFGFAGRNIAFPLFQCCLESAALASILCKDVEWEP
ncbi:hypothetical protein KC19_4G137400 [Ceratodon purpureus]|uniref:Uncharacterized protein n=1 Tax=Ceratodon purpureus TaxID=3225 RepID=A0A8T0I995_CERPU|nr:hypothetical protein KC19_4G137400 [Ceratodon purpureus]